MKPLSKEQLKQIRDEATTQDSTLPIVFELRLMLREVLAAETYWRNEARHAAFYTVRIEGDEYVCKR